MKGNINNLMKQAQAMQANMAKAQTEIASIEVTGESGGGMVKVTMSGKFLPYKYYGNEQGIPELGYKEE